MLARQIEELNIHTDPTLSRAKVNSITHDCPALTLSTPPLPPPPPPPLASFHSAPSKLYPSSYRLPPLPHVIRVSHLRRPSPGAVRPILRLLVRKYLVEPCRTRDSAKTLSFSFHQPLCLFPSRVQLTSRAEKRISIFRTGFLLNCTRVCSKE